MLQLVHISKIIRNFAVEKVMMSENKRNLTEKEEYYKLITDEKSNHIETNANGAGSQCVRRKNIGSLSFRERSLSLRKEFNELIVGLFFCAFSRLLKMLNCLTLVGCVCRFLCKFASEIKLINH